MTFSLRTRLILGPTLIVIIVIALAMALLVAQSRQRIADERDSSMQLARHLVEAAIKSRLESEFHPALNLRMDLLGMPQLRHVRMFVLPIDQANADTFLDQMVQAKNGWLWVLLHPEMAQTLIPISIYDQTKGQVLIIADPADEMDEIGAEFIVILGLLLGLTALFVGLAGWIVWRAMQPLKLLLNGLGQLQHGDFTATLPPFGLPELTPIGEGFNHLAAVLRQTRQDNDMLIGKLISLQESERRDLARELHDELGPCLFGIKSEAACIGRIADTISPDETKTRTNLIVKLVDDLQNMNRRILARLRPVALAELGVLAALERLVEDWRTRCPEIDWSFHCGHFRGEPSPDHALVLYRVVQECLTNAARHSQAQTVSVELDCGDKTRLMIVDDGCGIASDTNPGFGLMGMRERVHAIGGQMTVINSPDGGTVIEVLI